MSPDRAYTAEDLIAEAARLASLFNNPKADVAFKLSNQPDSNYLVVFVDGKAATIFSGATIAEQAAKAEAYAIAYVASHRIATAADLGITA